jgi:hypothetical protein
MSARISLSYLREIDSTLNDKDKKVLTSIRKCRYITTKHVQRLLFTDAITPSVGIRAANRNLNRLKRLELIDTLSRRVGGVRAGSGSLIWHLTGIGERLLRLNSSRALPLKRFFEPSPHFLAHTLAVTECFVQLTEICIAPDLELVTAHIEPDCWRPYSYKGKHVTLKPDLFAITICGEYEDRWFIEIDLHTEAPITVLEKCKRYFQYYRSGMEQKEHEIFPLTVWIVPNKARKESLISHIKAEFHKLPKIFIVITPNELKPLLSQGVEGDKLC